MGRKPLVNVCLYVIVFNIEFNNKRRATSKPNGFIGFITFKTTFLLRFVMKYASSLRIDRKDDNPDTSERFLPDFSTGC